MLRRADHHQPVLPIRELYQIRAVYPSFHQAHIDPVLQKQLFYGVCIFHRHPHAHLRELLLKGSDIAGQKIIPDGNAAAHMEHTGCSQAFHGILCLLEQTDQMSGILIQLLSCLRYIKPL